MTTTAPREVRAAALELQRRAELISVLAVLEGQGAPPILLKGTPLAYTHYPAPHRRPRCDTDLLIRRADVEVVGRVLEGHGYRRSLGVSGELVTSQAAYRRTDRFGVCHTLDIHWRISNAQAFAHLVTYEELAAQSEPVPALGPYARAPSPVYALLIACIHRVAHHHDTAYPVWLEDIHRLLERMSRQELEAFVELATAKRVCAICHRGLTLAQQVFGTTLPEDVMARLRAGADAPEEGSRATYLAPGRRRWHLFWADLTALPRWGDRARFVRETLAPSAGYMVAQDPIARGVRLPMAYLARAVRGFLRLARPLSAS